jgi:acylphosphatase
MSETVQGWVNGRVQGVGFRYFVQRCAEAEGLEGYAVNLPDGRVEVMLQGPSARVEKVQRQVEQGPSASQVDEVSWQSAPPYPHRGFRMG